MVELILNEKSTTDVILVQRIKPFTDREKNVIIINYKLVIISIIYQFVL